MDNINYNCVKDFVVLPDFYDFIEEDISKIFGTEGCFVVFNIHNLKMINEKYCSNTGDRIVKGVCESIKQVVSKHENIYGYRFGYNDFIITLPKYDKSSIGDIVCDVEDEFKCKTNDLELYSVKLDRFVLEYNQQINYVEDFYELMLNNVSVLGENEDAPRRIIKHIIGTFTNNIRNTLTAYREANNLAFTDDVSGISNHRAGKLFLSGLIEDYSKEKKGFAVMFIDGDNLKRYNNISYEAGNQMIKNLSQIITSSIRTEDKAFRWLSGDEFLVVLKEIDKKDSLNLAERIRKTVEEQTQSYVYPTTISIGVAHFPSDDNCIEEIIKKAEKANSYAKHIGRNKVVGWDTIQEDKVE
jgi:diguanylate cyclase (GGDEF)-like protein